MEPSVFNRFLGLVLLTGGILLSHLCIYTPLATAAAGTEPQLFLTGKGVIACPLVLFLGLLYLFLGERTTALLGTRHKPSVVAWLLVGLFAAAGVLLYLVVDVKLKQYGYSIS